MKQVELQTQWDAFLRLVQVKEPRLHEHLKTGRAKELTKYNLVVLAATAERQKEIEVGLKVYHERILELVPTIFGEGRGIKVELASKDDWAQAAPVAVEAPAPKVPAAQAPAPVAQDQTELLKVLEASIRQKIEAEVRASLQADMTRPENQGKLLQQVKEDFEQEEENRRLAVRMALIAEGDKVLTQLVMAWQQAKQTGDGGAQWNEVKARMLELLDTTVQLTQA
jgi:hypothetical protein